MTVYTISTDGDKSSVPSDVNVSGGGFSDGTEWVDFYLQILLDPVERDEEIRRLLANLKRSSADDKQVQTRIQSLMAHPQALASIVSQSRSGIFQVECRVLDENRVMGIGRIGLEVLFKGRFSDVASDAK